MRHQARNEMNVAAEAVELGNRDGAAFTVPAGLGECGGRVAGGGVRARVGALPGFDLDEFGGELVTLGGGEPGDGPPPASKSREQPNRAETGGSILHAETQPR